MLLARACSSLELGKLEQRHQCPQHIFSLAREGIGAGQCDHARKYINHVQQSITLASQDLAHPYVRATAE